MGNNPSVNKKENGDPILTNPVDSVSKAKALEFCEKLTAYERQMGYIGENEKIHASRQRNLVHDVFRQAQGGVQFEILRGRRLVQHKFKK